MITYFNFSMINGEQFLQFYLQVLCFTCQLQLWYWTITDLFLTFVHHRDQYLDSCYFVCAYRPCGFYKKGRVLFLYVDNVEILHIILIYLRRIVRIDMLTLPTRSHVFFKKSFSYNMSGIYQEVPNSFKQKLPKSFNSRISDCYSILSNVRCSNFWCSRLYAIDNKL